MAIPIEGQNQSSLDMSGQETGLLTTPANLGQLWRQWLAIIELFARQGRTHSQVDPKNYLILHRGLIATCRALARDLDNPKREIYERMDRLVSPWLSVGALEKADREILNDLLLVCRVIDRQLGGRRGGTVVRRCVALVLVALIATGSLLLVPKVDGITSPYLDWAKGRLLEARWVITHSDGMAWLFVGGAVVTVLAIYLVSRTARG
jgi:hypothetical protein